MSSERSSARVLGNCFQVTFANMDSRGAKIRTLAIELHLYGRDALMTTSTHTSLLKVRESSSKLGASHRMAFANSKGLS
jgi:hypothetical protein